MTILAEQPALDFCAMAEADVAAVRSLHALSFAALARDFHTPEQIAGHVALITGPAYGDELRRCHMELALRDGIIVATAGWLAVPDRPGTARIRKVFVHPAAARRGLGSRMVRRAEAAARAAGCDRLIVRANINAVGLYTRLGYVATAEVRMAVGGGLSLPAVMMEKTGG